ncbi:MAG: hypothetical protein DWH74_00130 [Planctomycetota bacterium]|nr:MAG: hypothetical protein DWH74_00130 [Planctomycetota bacterium]
MWLTNFKFPYSITVAWRYPNTGKSISAFWFERYVNTVSTVRSLGFDYDRSTCCNTRNINNNAHWLVGVGAGGVDG